MLLCKHIWPSDVQSQVHRLINATQPQGLILGGVVISEGVNHLLDLVKAIHNREKHFLARVADRFHDLAKAQFCHVFFQTKGAPSNMFMGYVDHQRSQSLMPSKHNIKKTHPNHT